MKSVMMLFSFAVIAILAKQANAGINLQSWQCQFSKNGDRTEQWISSTTGKECLKNKEAGYVLGKNPTWS